MFVKYIQQETQTRVQIKGQGSGFIDQETGHEVCLVDYTCCLLINDLQQSDEPIHIHITYLHFC